MQNVKKIISFFVFLSFLFGFLMPRYSDAMMPEMSDKIPCVRVIFVGETGVGKTALIRAIFEGRKAMDAPPLISSGAISEQMHSVKVPIDSTGREQKQINIFACDTPGKEPFRSVLSRFYRDVNIAFLCVNLDEELSTEKDKKFIEYWIRQLQENAKCSGAQCVIVLVGTKGELAYKTCGASSDNNIHLKDYQDKLRVRYYIKLDAADPVYARSTFLRVVGKCFSQIRPDLKEIRETLHVDFERVNRVDGDGRTPLIEAVEKGNIDEVKDLLSRGACVEIGRLGDDNVLHRAAWYGRDDILGLLLKEPGAKKLVNERNGFKHTPLHNAAIRGDCECIELLVAAGAEVNARCNGRCRGLLCVRTPLDHANYCGRKYAARALRKHGGETSFE